VGRMMRLKKNLGGKIATSAAGKSLIKDMLGPTTITVINILKELIESKDGKKKANEIENIAIKIGVKIILLYNNKNIPDRDLRKGLPFIKKIWSDALDFCEMSFSYNPEGFETRVCNLEQYLKDLLAPYVSQKTLTKISYFCDYIKDRDLLDMIYLEDQNENLKNQLGKTLREQWDMIYRRK